MTESLSGAYLAWLAPQIRDEGSASPNQSHWTLLEMMFEKEFDVQRAYVPYDDNRVADGRDLRAEFCHDRRIPLEALKRELHPVSFLEVLIGISRRLAFKAGGSAPGWAWQLVNNLELHRMTDPLGRTKQRRVNDILDRCISRNYQPDGQGGFFPLAWPDEDQTRVEISYQMAAFIAEIHPEY
jgi:hypothetical protein